MNTPELSTLLSIDADGILVLSSDIIPNSHAEVKSILGLVMSDDEDPLMYICFRVF